MIKKVKIILGIIFIAIILIVIFGTDIFSTKSADAAWYSTGGVWTYRKTIETNPQKISATASTTTSGNTTVGSTNNTSTANRMYLIPMTASQTGTVTNLQVRTDSTAPFNNPNFKGVITDSSFNLLTNGVTDVVNVLGSDVENWYTATFATPPSVTAGATYYIGFVVEDGNLYYDSTAQAGAYYHANNYASPTSPASPTSSTDYVSVYATINFTSTITNFPMLVSVTDSDLKYTDYGGKVASSTGGDILFTSAGGTTLLDFEIEKYASTTGELVAWIEIPFLSSTSTTPIYMYYGNASAGNNQNPTGVWDSNYKGVWHMNNIAASATVTDSTSNINTGTAADNTSVITTTGQLGNALTFNGSSGYIYTTTQFVNPQTQTIQIWFKTSLASGRKLIGFESSQTGTASANFDRHIYVGTDGKIYGGFYPNYLSGVTPLTYNNNAWHLATLVHNGTALVDSLYIDGVLAHSASVAGGPTNYSGYFRIGSYKLSGWTNGSDGYFTGSLDEARISIDIARSADWIKTEYNNQAFPNQFYSYGGLENYNGRVDSSGVTVPTFEVKGGTKVRGGVKFR